MGCLDSAPEFIEYSLYLIRSGLSSRVACGAGAPVYGQVERGRLRHRPGGSRSTRCWWRHVVEYRFAREGHQNVTSEHPDDGAMTDRAALHGLKVLDFTHALAGP